MTLTQVIHLGNFESNISCHIVHRILKVANNIFDNEKLIERNRKYDLFNFDKKYYLYARTNGLF